MCAFIFSTSFVWNIYHFEYNWATYCHEWEDFNGRFSKATQISNFIQIRPVGAELFNAHGRTDVHDEANGRFSQFCERAWKLLAAVI